MDSMTLEEALAAATVDDTSENRVLVIDSDLRTIEIPGTIKNLGVESDDDVNRLYFQMPKTYGEFDLSEFDIRINYKNGNVGDVYAVEDKTVEGDVITFSWLVGRNAVRTKGATQFIVCLKKSDASGVVQQEFNTTVASLNVLEGLEITEQVVQENTDIIEQILKKIDGLKQNETGIGSGNVITENIYTGTIEPSDDSVIWIDTTEDIETLLLDNSKWTDGYIQSGGMQYINNQNGEMYNTEFLPVTSKETYVFGNTNTEWTSNWIAVNFYTHNFDTTGHVSRVTGIGSSFEFTVPDGINYVLISSRNMTDYYTTATFEKKSSEDSKENGGEEIPSASTWKTGYIEEGGTINTTNIKKDEMYYDEYIPVVGGENYYVYNTDESWSIVGQSSNVIAGFYDENKTFISRSYCTLVRNGTWGKITVPENASFMRVSTCYLTDYYTTACISKELPTEAKFEDVVWGNGYVSNIGDIVPTANNGEMYTTPISVEEGATYRFGNSNAEWTSDWYGYGFYKNCAMEEFIERKTGVTEFTIPSGAKFIVISSRNMTDYYTTATFEKKIF